MYNVRPHTGKFITNIIFLILKIPEIAQIEKSFNYFSHKVLGLIKLIK